MTDSTVNPPPPPPPLPPPPSAPAAPTRRFPRPGKQAWLAGAAAAVVVLVAAAGFLVGRASVDDDRHPVRIERGFPQDGGPPAFGPGGPGTDSR